VAWLHTKDGDPQGFALYRRHYSAEKNPTPKQRQFVGPGEKLVLITEAGNALFAWRKEKHRLDGQTGVNCAVFRNESPFRSSDLIREAMSIAWGRWPGERLFTFVNPGKVRSTNPGCCFRLAGWRKCGRTKKGLLIFEVYQLVFSRAPAVVRDVESSSDRRDPAAA
jgi:hypothetical protein